MCGLCGIIYPYGKTVRSEQLQRMTDSIAHRGPDDEGFYIDGNLGFGFRRLSIIDIQGGHQPMANEDETVWVMLNGEIYNFHELKKTLIADGHFFRTNSDTEVLVHGWEKWGEGVVHRLRGMFALALWDKRQGKLFLARDRVGIKPLYYAYNGNRFSFASEIKALLALNQVDAHMDWSAFANYLRYGYTITPQTFYRGIRCLPPAHTMSLTRSILTTSKPKRYWDYNYHTDESIPENQWMEELRDLLYDSVRSHLVSDVPLGVFLSGGLDSSTVAAHMARIIGGNQTKTFSIGFQEDSISELPYARLVAQQYQTDHTERIVTADDIDRVDKIVTLYDEPFVETTSISYYLLCQMAKEEVTVALGGDGGDELFGGYNKYNTALGYMRFDVLPSSLRRLIFGSFCRLWPENVKGYGIISRLALDASERFSTIYGVFPEYLWDKYITEDARKCIKEVDDNNQPRMLYEHRKDLDAISKMGFVDARTYMVDCILRRVDIISMAHSLEVRVPILDHEVVEFACRIPARLKIRNGELKYIWKEAARSILPDGLFTHRKQGFFAPYGQWFKNKLYPYLKDELITNPNGIGDVFKLQAVERLIDSHKSGSRDLSAQIWAIYIYKKWQDKFSPTIG